VYGIAAATQLQTGEIATEILTAADMCGIAEGTQLQTQER